MSIDKAEEDPPVAGNNLSTASLILSAGSVVCAIVGMLIHYPSLLWCAWAFGFAAFQLAYKAHPDKGGFTPYRYATLVVLVCLLACCIMFALDR